MDGQGSSAKDEGPGGPAAGARHAWRRRRSFMAEYVVVVAGVLTALAAEQVVQRLHWQWLVRDAERAIRKDLSLTADIASERVAIGRCLDARLTLLRRRVEGAPEALSTPLPAHADGFPMAYAYRAPSRAWNAEVWDGALADGTWRRLKRERARSMNLLYLTVRSSREANHQEKAESSDLEVLGQADIPLSADKRIELLQHIERLQRLNGELTSLSRQILRRIDDLGYLPSLADTERRLAGPYSRAMSCRFAPEDLKTRVLDGWFTLNR